MTLIEKVAQIMAESINGGEFWRDGDSLSSRTYTPDQRKVWYERAKLIIGVIKEPSELKDNS